MFRRHLSDTIRGRRHEPFRFLQGDMEVVAVDSGTGRKENMPVPWVRQLPTRGGRLPD